MVTQNGEILEFSDSPGLFYLRLFWKNSLTVSRIRTAYINIGEDSSTLGTVPDFFGEDNGH